MVVRAAENQSMIHEAISEALGSGQEAPYARADQVSHIQWLLDLKIWYKNISSMS